MSKKSFIVSYRYGFSETVTSMSTAKRRLLDSAHTGKIEIDPDDSEKYREYRDTGPDGPGWYFVGRITRVETLRRFRVRGICYVPTEVEMEIEAPNAKAAVIRAKGANWKEHIGANSGDHGAAFDWQPTAEEIPTTK